MPDAAITATQVAESSGRPAVSASTVRDTASTAISGPARHCSGRAAWRGAEVAQDLVEVLDDTSPLGAILGQGRLRPPMLLHVREEEASIDLTPGLGRIAPRGSACRLVSLLLSRSGLLLAALVALAVPRARAVAAIPDGVWLVDR